MTDRVDETQTAPIQQDGAEDLAVILHAQHDPRAFAPLYQKYSPSIYRYCYRRLGNADHAADLTSMIFTRALGALKRFRADPDRPGSTVRSWLFAIAHNVVVDHHRRARHHRSLDNAAALTESPLLTDPGPSPESSYAQRETQEQVRHLLSTLPERQRQIVELRMAGLTGLEIAAALGMSHSAVKSAQFRAYAALRETALRSEITHE